MGLKKNLEEFVKGFKESCSNIKEFGKGFKDSANKIANVITYPAFIGASGALYSIYGYSTEKYVSAIAATTTTLYGIYAYFADKWPFTEISENEYQPLQWITGHKGRILKGPGTTWFFPPFERKIIKNKELQKISGEILPNDSGKFDFRTQDGLSGTLIMQYLYQVTDKKGAKKFFWDYGKDATRLNEPIVGTLVNAISGLEGQKVLSEKKYLKDAEEAANTIINGDEGAGIKVTNFAITNPIYDSASDRILKTQSNAKVNAEARIIQAQAEAIEAHILQEATKSNMDGYAETGKKLHPHDEEKAGKFAEKAFIVDNIQQIFSSIAQIFTKNKSS